MHCSISRIKNSLFCANNNNQKRYDYKLNDTRAAKKQYRTQLVSVRRQKVVNKCYKLWHTLKRKIRF